MCVCIYNIMYKIFDVKIFQHEVKQKFEEIEQTRKKKIFLTTREKTIIT